MRLSAYIRAVSQAEDLPDRIDELREYFNNDYSPRMVALNEISRLARIDTNGLTDGELLKILDAINKIKEEHYNK